MTYEAASPRRQAESQGPQEHRARDRRASGIRRRGHGGCPPRTSAGDGEGRRDRRVRGGLGSAAPRRPVKDEADRGLRAEPEAARATRRRSRGAGGDLVAPQPPPRRGLRPRKEPARAARAVTRRRLSRVVTPLGAAPAPARSGTGPALGARAGMGGPLVDGRSCASCAGGSSWPEKTFEVTESTWACRAATLQ
jgi:hypothetical protein